MKQPYFNAEQRAEIHFNTILGATLLLDLQTKKLLREVHRDKGYIAMKRVERSVARMLNMELLGSDAPRRWWQIF